MLELFAANLLPVFLAAGAGYVLARQTGLDPRPISQVAFYVLAPCLVFNILAGSEVDGAELVRMVGFTTVSLLSLAALAMLVVWFLGLPRPLSAAVVLVTLLPNAGNYGLSVSLFAFDESGLAQASVYFVTSSMVTFTVGVLVASSGRASVGTALAGLVRVPAVWAVLFALVCVGVGWELPVPAQRTVGLLAGASIPIFLILLGMQLHGHGVGGPWVPLGWSVGLRLLGGVAVGWGLATVFGLEGVAKQVGLLQSAMPSAVISIILATEYDTEPAFVTSAVFVSTLVSPLTLTPLLAYLGA